MQSGVLPDKLYFKIGEVSQLVGVKPYVLRYWETEFKEISPVKSRSNQRLYRKSDVQLLLKISKLLYNERFTINGAKKQLKTDKEINKARGKKVSQLNLKLKGQGHSEPPESKNLVFELKKLKKEMAQFIR